MLAALAALAAPASAYADAGYRAPGNPSYEVELRADGSGTRFAGRESVRFENTGPARLDRVWLRLWGNGAGGCARPAVQVSSVRGATAEPLAVDCTALPLALPAPLAPGGTASVSFTLTIAVPPRSDRFGQVGGVVLGGNAIPLLAIQDAGGPHLDPYVAFGESFYSQIGRFRVRFDVPRGLTVAATGSRVSRVEQGGRVVEIFRADQVRDFAWALGALHERVGTVRPGLRVRVWSDRRVPERTLGAALGWAVSAMRRLEGLYGPYPYPEVEVVIVPFPRFGGMEYPTLVMATPVARAVRHELAHQWWYGIVGDDQYHEPWLDEAFATYSEATLSGIAANLCDHVSWPAPDARVSAGMDYWSRHQRDYSAVVYRAGACTLQRLGEVLGLARLRALLRQYLDAHRFGWSTTTDFVAAANQAAAALTPPVDLTAFWAEHRIG